MNELRDIRQRFRELRATAMSAAGANHALDKDLFTLAEKTEAYVTEARAIALSLRAGPLPSGRGSCWGGGLRLEDEVEERLNELQEAVTEQIQQTLANPLAGN